MIEKARAFVAAADEVWRLQRGDDPDCRLFQALANRAHYRGADGTRQGIYIVTPSGRLLASANSLDPQAVVELIDRGMRAWEDAPAGNRHLPEGTALKPRHRWEFSRPRDGLVLTSLNRELAPVDNLKNLDPAAEKSDRWNRDHVWFNKEEARRWLPADLSPGARQPVPDLLVQRLTRYHLVDNVRGQTLPFAAEDMAGSELLIEVTARDGPIVKFKIIGRTEAASSAAWGMGGDVWKPEPEHRRGVATRVLGYAAYDTQTERFTRFDLIAIGLRWGFSENNARGEQREPTPIGFWFTLTPDGPAENVPPAFIDVYNADWLVRPAPR